jgi:hypothetical protein
MANPEHLALLVNGSDVWNKWRTTNPHIQPDLSRADIKLIEIKPPGLMGIDLRRALLGNSNLNAMDLTSSDLSGANLMRASLVETSLQDTSLVGTNFMEANLLRADLRGADLTGALLAWTNLSGADIEGANFFEAVLSETTLADIDLGAAKNLESAKHWAPSSVGIETFYRSKGKIPLPFLRGTGIPENFIEYISSLMGTTFEYYSCFISYSSKDQEFADRMYADLQKEGVRCWFAPHHVQSGKKLHEQIDVAIRLHERLLLILSPNSINSEWVKTEIAKARKREIQEGKRVLFPVRLNMSFEELQEWECFDADRGKDSAREIREYYIPDFTEWKDHDRYQEEFTKLLRDLKKGEVSAGA